MLQINLKPTRARVELVTNGGTVEARVWEGQSAGGVALQALIVGLAATDQAEQLVLESELKELPGPIPNHTAFPPRMTI